MFKKHKFTLIELLIVVSIILILVGIAVPVYLLAMKKARAGQAAFQIKALQTAITGYKTEYQYLPFFPAYGANDVQVNEDAPATSGDGYNDLIITLRGANAVLNPRQLEFLSQSAATYVDPYGHNFYVSLDLDGSGTISTDNLYAGAQEVNSDIAIWSLGPNGDEQLTPAYDRSAASPLNDDNITSW